MAQCEIEISKLEFNSGRLRGVVVSSTPDKEFCRALFEMGIPAPFCPLESDKKPTCPLVQAAREEIPVRVGIGRFFEMISQ